jgi:hypothetical protein
MPYAVGISNLFELKLKKKLTITSCLLIVWIFRAVMACSEAKGLMGLAIDLNQVSYLSSFASIKPIKLSLISPG